MSGNKLGDYCASGLLSARWLPQSVSYQSFEHTIFPWLFSLALVPIWIYYCAREYNWGRTLVIAPVDVTCNHRILETSGFRPGFCKTTKVRVEKTNGNLKLFFFFTSGWKSKRQCSFSDVICVACFLLITETSVWVQCFVLQTTFTKILWTTWRYPISSAEFSRIPDDT